ncbi:FUSC family protein [Micromonospora globispora]|uniref:FUSC family protein n=1 Tax=Micromonospora globispora TaxID=1450148 RepID=UPI000D703C07|nr:FUSC family protein [Micromonospora globispora]PWU58294.1 FUSC family protein [Micromonospora globispora]RQX00152.1 FUSC family protein [Micromonospora globispora]
MSEQVRAAVRGLLHVRPVPGAHRVALRAGISVLVPLLAVLALDRPGWSVYAAFGAFTSLYGRNHVHLSRAAMQASAGAALTVSVVLGVLVGTLESRAWVVVPVAAAVAALGAVLAAAQDWHPPGPLFLIFAFGAVASAPHPVSDVPVAAAVAGLSSLFALLVGNVGSLVRRQKSRPARLAHVWSWEPVRYAVAAVLAGGTATAVGIGHPYWAMVAAVAPLSARGVTAQLVRAGHRILGTLLGLLTSAALLAPQLSPYATVLVVAALQIVTELLVGRNYGLALLFITPMALLMGQLAAARPTGQLLFDRGVETVIGAVIGGAIVLCEPWLRARIATGQRRSER